MGTDHRGKYNLEPHEVSRIIGMAWEDRTSFEPIYAQFGLTEEEVIDFMRRNLKQKKAGKTGFRSKNQASKIEK